MRTWRAQSRPPWARSCRSARGLRRAAARRRRGATPPPVRAGLRARLRGHPQRRGLSSRVRSCEESTRTTRDMVPKRASPCTWNAYLQLWNIYISVMRCVQGIENVNVGTTYTSAQSLTVLIFTSTDTTVKLRFA